MISTLLRAAALAAVFAVAPALAQSPIVLKLTADTPDTGGIWKDAIVPWAKKVEADTKGTIKIELHPNGTLSKTGDSLDRAGAGVADIAWENPGALGARLASLGVVGVPGVVDHAEIASAALWRGYEKGVIGAEFRNEKVRPLLIFATPTLGLHMIKPMKDTGDVKGLKFAIGSKLRAQQIEKQGGVPVALNPQDYYQSMQKGVIDGVFTSLVATVAVKADEQAHYYLRGPFGGGITIIAINKEKYDSLPAEARKAFDDNSGEKGSKAVGAFAEKFEDAQWERLAKVPGNQIVKMGPADVAKWKATYDFVAEGWVKDTPNGAAILAAFKAAVADVTAGK